jgi:hypothetical protein
MRQLLAIDAAANYLLGVPLLLAPGWTSGLLGLPDAGSGFYARVLGGVLTGIATALAIEQRRAADEPAGLGTAGAIAINLFGGGATAASLVTGETDRLPKRGKALLWGVTVSVLGIGGAEARGNRHRSR